MENNLLIGLSRQVALQRQMNVIANNLANMQTSGYKAEKLKFEEMIMPVAKDTDLTGNDADLSYVYDVAHIRDFREGDFVPTGNPFDIAINGSGWFAVETPEGERYTRNGHLKIDAEGRLTTPDGHPVLTTSGVVTIGAEEKDFSVASDGTISTSDGEKGRLRIVRFENEALLEKLGNSLYASPEPGEDAAARIAQGVVEKSNVVPISEISRMIEVSRSYINVSNMLEKSSSLRQRAIEELGQVQA